MSLKEKISKYIQTHSSSSVRNRAKSIFLELKRQEENKYEFTYQGSDYNPYEIRVLTGKQITTKCTCPYAYGGLCKHEVAALNYIVNNNSEEVKVFDLFENEMKKENEFVENLRKGRIYLKNHLFTEETINKITKELRLKKDYYNSCEIDEVTEGNATVIVYSYRTNVKFHFSYNEQDNFLIITDKFGKSVAVNQLVVDALETIIKTFGEGFFHPYFLNQHKELFAKNNNIPLQYLKYYDFTISKNGIYINEKVKNLCPNIKDFYDKRLNLSDEIRDSLSILSHSKSEMNKTHGLGFCFEFYYGYENDLYVDFTPFQGKYKKNTTELSTSFKKITDSTDIVDFNLTEKEQLILLKASEIVDKIEKFNNDISLNNIREVYIILYDFVKSYKDKYPFYLKFKENTSFINKNLTLISFSDVVAKTYFTIKENKEFLTLTPRIRIENSYQLNSKSLITTPFFCLKDKKTIHFFNSPRDYVYLFNLGFPTEINIPITEKDKVLENVILPLSEFFEVEQTILPPKRLPKNTNLKKELYLSDYEGEYVIFKLGVRYDDHLILTHTKEQIYNKETQQLTVRNTHFEDEFIEYFKELHPDFQKQNGIFYLEPHQLIEEEWLLKASQKLKQKDVEIFGAKDLKSFKYSLHQASISVGVNSEIDWFDLNIEVKFGKEKVSLKEIRKSVLNKNKYVQLKDGTLGMLPDKWLKKFAKYFKAGEIKGKSVKISNYQFNIIDDLYEDLETTPKFLMELQKKKQNLQNLKNIAPVKVPKTLKATLRPYQQEGLNWLVFLNENQLGGCLADDMGLGKTLQTIGLLLYLKQKQKSKKVSLIVAPTSLIFNWQKEFEKFAPSMKILVYTGIDRQKELKNFEKHDVVLTTYGLVLNDIESLKEKSLNYVILDESQAIKNPNSKRYKTVRLLNADNRLALTGTPIENNTFDLYAQMNFINPGLLGSMSHFKGEFSDAIDKGKNREASDLLHEIIYPFLLRRTKKQVATDLPEKTENILYCEMGKEQRKVYEAFKEKYREYLLKQFEENGEGKSQMYVLEGLTKLRQICNSPQLLNEEEEYTNVSVKLDTLLENVKTITSEGSKVLVFSQFTSMLALIQARLDTDNIVYEYLDGQTRNRDEKVQNFQENDNVKVFLISLKAGGTGLNLTKAEYVFLVDPWWNPAVENQAIDRCYRIGQTQNVIAYRMICKDTIEEKIVALQENKKVVSESIIQIDKQSKSFNKERVKELFS